MSADPLARYLKPVPKGRVAMWLFALSLLGFSAWQAVELRRHHAILMHRKAALSDMQQRALNSVGPAPTPAMRERDRQWTALRKELDFSWYPVFAGLEHTNNPDIALLEFVPDKAAGTVVLRGTAHDMVALTTYLNALSNEPVFRDVFLTHQKKVLQGAVTVVSFELRLKLVLS